MIILQVVVFPMLQSTSESDEPIHIINVGIKFSKKEKYSDNDLAVRFQDFCKERVRALIWILFVFIKGLHVKEVKSKSIKCFKFIQQRLIQQS